MIGQLNSQSRDVTVVGAGIAGLLAAYSLDRAGYRVTLLEGENRAGGLISTKQTRHGLAEAAAHSIMATPAVRELCGDLGVEWVPVRRDSRARFVWRHGKLKRFPLSLGEALRGFLRAYVVLADSTARSEHLTLEQWGLRFLGEAPLKFLLTPFVRGIYGAKTSEIRVGEAFPSLVVPHGHSLLSLQLHKLLMRLMGKGGPKRARSIMIAPKGGMNALISGLEKRLKERLGDRFRLGVKVSELPAAANLVLCVPANAAADLLESSDAELARALRGIVYSPLVSVTAFVEKLGFGRAPRGVGVLLPEGTSRKTLGVLFNSSSFPNRVLNENTDVSLTLMLGGSEHPEILEENDLKIQADVRADLEKIFDLAPGARLETVVHRWPRAIPQYNGALQSAWRAANQGWCSQPGRILFGNYTGQVSIRGMIELAARLQTTRI